MGYSASPAGEIRQFGGYWLGRRLGAGGQGVVYEAYGASGERVAIKLLRLDRADSSDARARFAKEVAAAERVAGFCTARVIAADLGAAEPYIVSEYVDGPSLHRAIAERGPYSPAELHRLATGIATALTAIHMAEVVHRDLKPENVVLGSDGPRVIDFGIARFDGATLTDEGLWPAGTPAYMSPERLRGEPAEYAADIWSWGAVLLFAATGRPPFLAETAQAIYHLVLTRPPDFSALDGMIRYLVEAAMRPDPAERPTAKSLLLSLVGGKGETRLLLSQGSRAARRMPRPEVARAPADRPLGEVAENVYTRLDPADREVVPAVVLRMVLPGDGADGALRRAYTGDLLDGTLDSARVRRVIDGFAGEDLLLSDGEMVTLASAALLRAWPRLRGWIDADRPGLRLHSMLSETARMWEAAGRHPADLYRGTALRAAQDWVASEPRLRVNQLERRFLTESAVHERHGERRRRRVKAALAALTALSVATTLVLIQRGMTENGQRELAAARKAAETADLLRARDPVKALLLSVAAWRLAPAEPAAAGALYSSLAQRESHVLVPPAGPGEAHFDLSADGTTLVLVRGGDVSRWDVQGGHRLPGPAFNVGEEITAIALSPDETTLAVAGRRSVRLWDLRTGRAIGAGFGSGGAGHLAFNAGGNVLVALDSLDGGQTWDLTGLPDTAPRPLWGSADPGLRTIAVSPDGSSATMVYENRPYQIVDRGNAPLPRPGGARPVAGDIAAYSPDGLTLAVGTRDAVRLWDLTTATWAGPAFEGGTAHAVALSPRGDHVATLDDTGITLWRRDGTRLLTWPAREAVGEPRFDASARTLSYRHSDGTVTRLDIAALTSARPIVRRAESGAIDEQARIAFVQGSTVTLAGPRAPPRRLDVRGGGRVAAFSPDGALLAMTGADPARVTIWDVATGTAKRTLTLRRPLEAISLAFSPDGGTLAVSPHSGGQGERLRLWNLRRGGTSVETLDLRGGPRMAFSRDGRLLAVNGTDHNGVAELTSPRGYRHQLFGSGGDGGRPLAIDPAGRFIAAGGPGAGVDLWDAAGFARLRTLRVDDEHEQLSLAAFTPDGGLLAAAGASGRIWLWRPAGERPLGAPVPLHAGKVLALAFTADGRTLRSLGADGVLNSLPVDPALAAADICRRIGAATLTEEEWTRILPGVNHREIC
ncbi:serine/threonine-protein kinase [Nonomuraea jiangxiensis]|uniref:non-specific serine/threonine protein kinase n=1 Tax=Nonomuraea jiangxiensis TaxID=633440 RepID=A0A1G9QMZ6_9ACTN|nr:WD40 repeat domain-containing serine/threonine-protein kinase [Nonomuraea jiangxiensis]SDM12379.1 Serine/threonine protein kinase [Nonomuraea jiangxiensis]